jgi:uncharacterized sodium:solute symporter family permease YidK
VAAFLFGILVPQAPPAAGIVALLAGPAIYAVFQLYAKNLHFLIQVAVTFQLLLLFMGLVTFWKPLDEPRSLPERKEMNVNTEPIVIICGAAVIAAVVVFTVIFR